MRSPTHSAPQLGNKGFGEPLAFDNTYYKSLLAKPWLNKVCKGFDGVSRVGAAPLAAFVAARVDTNALSRAALTGHNRSSPPHKLRMQQSDPMAEMIGLPSDHVLSDDAQCRPWIEKYAADQQRFFEDFAAAYVKMCSLGACWA